MLLKDQVALITGASRGVGAATARLLASLGCCVALNHRNSGEAAERVAAGIRLDGGQALVIQGDVSSDEDCRRLVKETTDAFGRLDILVNNAGTTRFIPFAELESVTDEDWSHIFSTNVKGVFQCSRAAVPAMKAVGKGVIINVASVAAFVGAGSSIPYSASKAAVVNMTVGLARTLCPEIRVNAVAPGAIDGEWLRRGLGESYEAEMKCKAEAAPLKRISRPEDIAQAILGLILAQQVTGQVLKVDGGATLGPAIQHGIR